MREFDITKPWGKEARREDRVNNICDKLFGVMFFSLVFGGALNLVAVGLNSLFLWKIAACLCGTGIVAFLMLFIIVGKWL